MKHLASPEVLVRAEKIDTEGVTVSVGDLIAGIEVRVDENTHRDGTVQIDLRNFERGRNLVISISLPDLVAALSCATLHREKS